MILASDTGAALREPAVNTQIRMFVIKRIVFRIMVVLLGWVLRVQNYRGRVFPEIPGKRDFYRGLRLSIAKNGYTAVPDLSQITKIRYCFFVNEKYAIFVENKKCYGK